jgi:hypothetical protein
MRWTDDIATHIGRPIDMATTKTTLDISDPLLREARKTTARKIGRPCAFVEHGLRQSLPEKAKDKLERASATGVFKPHHWPAHSRREGWVRFAGSTRFASCGRRTAISAALPN